jgi:serine/threonine protein phosphatase 1
MTPLDPSPQISDRAVPVAPVAQGRHLVVGDVHGHYDTLLRLLDLAAPGFDTQVHFLGDLVDRGPDSAKVIQFVRQQGYHTLIGNHEQLLMQAMADCAEFDPTLDMHPWFYSGGIETLASYGGDLDRVAEDAAWLEQQPYWEDLGDFWLVHAGVNPKRTADRQYNHELCWIRDEFHSVPKPYFPDKTIITGHTITFTFFGIDPGQVVRGAGWLGIDTGVYHPRSGWLTALDLSSGLLYQVNRKTKKTRVSVLDEVARPYQKSAPDQGSQGDRVVCSQVA